MPKTCGTTVAQHPDHPTTPKENNMFEWIDSNTWVLYVAVAVIAFRIGYWVHAKYFLWIMFHNPERLQHALKMMERVKNLDDTVLARTDQTAEELIAELESGQELIIERQADLLYAYDKATLAFIAQGASLEQVFEQARQRFPHKKFFGEIAKENTTKQVV
jgi:hypothetical protein